MASRRRMAAPPTLTVVVVLLVQFLAAGIRIAMTDSVSKAFSKDQTVTSSTLAWEKFNGEVSQLQYAVRSYDPSEHPRSKEVVEKSQSHASYICRIQIEGIYCAGQTHMEDQSTICTASLQSDIRRHRTFEVLVNRGGGGKLKWQPWTKFHTELFVGAISASNSKVDSYYVARIKQEHHGNHHHPFIVGNYDPKEKLGGRIFVPLPGDATEHERGDILIEIEPVRYELRNIKLNKLKTVINKTPTILGSTILTNEEDTTNQAETVLTYDYQKITSYGRQPGVGNGIPTKVVDPRTLQLVDMFWGVDLSERIFETKAINTILQAGTAINVTMVGNYTAMEAPYHATLRAYYDDNSDPATRRVNGYMVSKDMEDIKIEFSPVYWIENGTLVPTTTTTSTTTTTTTTTSTTQATTTTVEPVPIGKSSYEDNIGGVLSIPEDDGLSNEIDRSPASGASREEIASSRSVDKPESSISLSSIGGSAGGSSGSSTGALQQQRLSTVAVIASMLCFWVRTMAHRV